MINTLPHYPHWNDVDVWGPPPPRGVPHHQSPHHHSLPPIISSSSSQHIQQHETAPSLASTRTGGNGESSLMDGDSSHNNSTADTSPFLSLTTSGPHVVNISKSTFYGSRLSHALTDDPSRSFGQATSSPFRRKHVMEDRVKNPCKVFIGGIGQGTVETTIRQHFSQYGTVRGVLIMMFSPCDTLLWRRRLLLTFYASYCLFRLSIVPL